MSNIFITDTHFSVLRALRAYDNSVNLVHTIPHGISRIKTNNIQFQKLKEVNIDIINIKSNKYIKENFSIGINNNLKCFFWGVNTRIRMKKILQMNINGESVEAIYTDYPDRLNEIKKKCGIK